VKLGYNINLAAIVGRFNLRNIKHSTQKTKFAVEFFVEAYFSTEVLLPLATSDYLILKFYFAVSATDRVSQPYRAER
jgi:hypothetical protein